MPKNLSILKTLNLLFFFILLSCLIACNSTSTKNDLTKKREGQRERIERDIKMMKDPALGYVPTNRLLAAKEYKDQLIQSQSNAAIAGINWQQLGPKNQGGRSRTMLVDANDVTGNTVWVGSVGGGLWKTTNITAAEPAWAPVDDFFANLAITSIVQDPATPSIMYFCTGEQGYGNADAIRGLGIWKSTNSGATWAQLSSTNNSNFNNCQRMIVNSNGIVMVATTTGLRRSADGGTTWTKVLGTGLGITGAVSNFCYDVDIAANGDVYATLSGSIHKSTNAGLTFAAAQTIPISATRIELACAPNDANYLYALIENGNVVNGIIRSINGGTSWTSRTEPADADPGIPATDFSRSQAWYDLTIAVDPNNRDVVFVGGIDIFKSFDGCGTWSQITHWYGGFGFQNVHADQHYILFQPGSSTIAYFANDGGIYRSINANNAVPTISDKGTNYITAQFYACAMHPTALTNYFLAGAQDNGSHQFTQAVVQNTTEVTGGDGAFTHIDQDQPQFQFTSYVFNEFHRSTNGGASWSNGIQTSGGEFISPTDYDDVNNKLYMCNTSGTYRRWDDPQTGATFVAVTAGFGDQVSAVKVSPNTSNRVFFGTEANGDVFRVDNANTGTPTVTNISTGLPAGYVSCIEVETGNDNHLLAVYSNYGTNSIWESTNGGSSWTSVEGNLPDMPIRWALFNPNNNDQAVIATELGVWSTDNLNGGATVWGPSNSGLANVRVDMLQLRQSDKVMIAATHGRGLFLSSFFAAPTALFTADKVTSYRGVPINFTSTSYNGTSWSWNFGDAGTSTAENPSHIYSVPGKYTVALSINSGLSTITKNLFIHILPNRGTPYAIASGGNFEAPNHLDFGVDNANGTPWERGNSAVAGKNGFVSASNAWVTGLTGNYLDNTDARLMTPNYNFTTVGAYTMNFRNKRSTESGYDGFRVEYTLDSGRNWTPLGTTVQANWYNFGNTVGDAAFPVNQAFFSGNVASFTLCSYDMTFLGGNRSVAFRIRFKSDGGVVSSGVAIDDFEIVGPINIALAVKLISFGANKNGNDVNLNWLTTNEKDINSYSVKKSVDGQTFTPIGTIAAKNTDRNTYTYIDKNATLGASASTLYYRLRIIDNAARYKYSDIAKVQVDKDITSITLGPNPFTNYVFINTASTINTVTVYNAAGKLIVSRSTIVGNKIYLDKALPNGMYLFKIKTAAGEVVRKLMKQ